MEYKLIKTLFTLSGLITFVGIPGIVSTQETHYTKQCSVLHASQEEALLQDNIGNWWTITPNAEGLDAGEVVKVTFDNRHTSLVIDDKIIKIER